MPEQPVSTQKRMTDLLMIADAPWLATIIMGVSQPFAQLRELVGLPSYLPLVVAFCLSVLLAIYWVGVEQRIQAGQSLLIIPVVAMMLFSASIGANNVVNAATSGGPASSPGAPPEDASQLSVLKQQIELLQQQLDLEKQKTAILDPSAGSVSMDTSGRNLSGWFASTAYAQSPQPIPRPTLGSDQREKLVELENKQKELERKQFNLMQREQLRERSSAPLWKSW